MNCAEESLHVTVAIVDEEALVAVGVLEVGRHLLADENLVPFKVAIAHEALSTTDRIALGLKTLRFEVTVAEWFFFEILGSTGPHVFPTGDLGGEVDVIQRRHCAAEAVRAEKLLGVKPTVGLSELNVVLFGQVS